MAQWESTQYWVMFFWALKILEDEFSSAVVICPMHGDLGHNVYCSLVVLLFLFDSWTVLPTVKTHYYQNVS